MKVRDALNKNGNSGDIKDKCPWFDELDKILGCRPTVYPVDLVESCSTAEFSSPKSSSPSTSHAIDAVSVNDNQDMSVQSSSTNDADEKDSNASPTGQQDNASSTGQQENASSTGQQEVLSTNKKPVIPGAKSQKHLGRKRKNSQSDDLEASIKEQTLQLQQLLEAEQARQTQENVALEGLLKAQKEAEEKRMQMMLAQQQMLQMQQANTEKLSQFLGNILTYWPSNPTQLSGSSHHQASKGFIIISVVSHSFHPCLVNSFHCVPNASAHTVHKAFYCGS
ncbi:hypothetical protein WMY93_013936 [Mugilogobius chulae]|uniref:Uncharacterized protein n=1 Tax=Mugilogobius chulae TaxID=88201 RepID=A0AAW0PAE4_9GOBI